MVAYNKANSYTEHMVDVLSRQEVMKKKVRIYSPWHTWHAFELRDILHHSKISRYMMKFF